MIKVYGVPSCDQIKKTKTFFQKENIEFTFVNIRKETLDRDKLNKVIDQLGIDVVLNRRGMLYRKLGLKDKNLNNDQLADELFNEQGMIKRPLIEQGKLFHIGYNEQEILKFLKE
ncbi:MAG: Spx/MgsR family RNA polymerase-binding regulatory protein [Calditrichaeota bacterium]|nr:MAG: arsenate reductase [Calditrichota bacterium]MBL1205534.1 Spx/MgsR family RNA polymerase-binding regulatory protein [Calditrichota bacterium]NOG45363.1 Spx/MgsR family RNA polymerase-binding regulatory protein [Calditrichota bacterium]